MMKETSSNRQPLWTVTVGALPHDSRFCFIYRAIFITVIPDVSFISLLARLSLGEAP